MRARVRAVLYMGALSASRHNPLIRAFYQRLLAAVQAQKGGPHRLHAQVCWCILIRDAFKHLTPPGAT